MNIPNTIKKYSPILFSLIGLLCALTAQGQPGIEWEKTYGGSNWEELQAMSYDDDTGYIFAGSSSTNSDGDVTVTNKGDSDAWIIRTDVNGNLDWQHGYGCDGNERIWDILPLDDGTYFILGESSSDACIDKTEDSRGFTDYWLIKTDALGNKIWDRTYGGDSTDIARRILPTDDGHFLIAGYSWSNDAATSGIGERTIPSRGEADVWLVKITPDGDVVDDYVFGGQPLAYNKGKDFLYDLTKMDDGTFLLGCWSECNAGFEKTNDAFGRNDYWLIHIDENGQKVGPESGRPGDYIYGGNSVDALQEVIVTIDGGILLVGESFSESNSNPVFGNKTTPHYGDTDADEDFWIVKLNPDFTIDWQKTYGGNQQEFPHVVWENRSGKLWIAGDSTSPKSGNKEDENPTNSKVIWMILLTPEGEKIWEQTYGGTGNEAPEEILAAHDGGYIIGAHSSSDQSFWKSEDSRGANDFWIIKTDCPIYEADMDIETDVCLGQPFELAPEFALCPDCDFQWTDGTEDTIRVVSLTENTDYEVLITDDNGCEETAIVQTVVQSNPEILELDIKHPTCTDDTDGYIDVLEVDGGIEPYEYTISDNNFSGNTEFRNLGADEYHLILRDSIGCLADSIITLPNPLEPLIDIGEDLILELGDSLLIQVAVSPGVDTFIWSNPDLVSCPDCPFTYTRPTVTTLYQITAYNEQGCEVRDTKSVGVKREFPYYAPTAFSPDT